MIQRSRPHLKYYQLQPGEDKIADFDLDDDAIDEMTGPEPKPESEELDVIKQSDESAADGIQHTSSAHLRLGST